jgi:sterol desaturase/sphingolipid hydroxylase (fatty acid hydroxylase superfamily)
MELYGKVLLWAMPIFLLLVFLEKLYGVLIGKDTYQNMDMISSLSSGVSNVVKDVLGLSFTILSYQYMVTHWAIYHIPSSIWVYVITFVVMDFQGYWVHRWAHKINLFWNKHAVHHSSEDFNLACALRQSVSSFVNLFTFFLLPAALLGIEPQVIAIVAPIQLFAQFWYHTEHIKRMGFLENIIVTPSHHRVHHAMNKEYMDKNMSQIFIIWDKLFGTFQEELPDVPPVYGITRPSQTWNPIKINFQHLWLLIKDAWRAKDWKDKFRIWWMPTGWRPADVEAKYPVFKIENVYHFEKYHTSASKALHVWAWIQFFVTVFFVFYFFANIGKIEKVHDLFDFLYKPNILLYGLFIFIAIYAYTELMDKNRYALVWELIKNMLGMSIIWAFNDWFGISALHPLALPCIIAYFVVSTLITLYFVTVDFDRKKGLEMA